MSTNFTMNRRNSWKDNQWTGFLVTIIGMVTMLVCLVMFGISAAAINETSTTVSAYTEQWGLTSIMGIWPMIIFYIFMAISITALSGGSVIQWRLATGGTWTDLFLIFIMGCITLVICLIFNGTIQAELHTIYLNLTSIISALPGVF